MSYLLIRHKVRDFNAWKPVYDAHLAAREAAGLRELHLLRNVEDATEVVLLFEAENLGKAREFASSEDLRHAMARADGVDQPDIYFLDREEQRRGGVGLVQPSENHA
jgi:heme-degrading monooxygenase HmoA